MNELVSIIVPVYNCKEFIGKCLNSVIEQNYCDIELIVVDDGSTDGTDQIIKEILKEKENVISIQQKNMGVSAARNRGLQRATGKYLLFLDGDDYIGEDYVSHLVEMAEANNSDLVIGGYTKVNPKGNLIEKIVPGKYIPIEHEEWAYRITAVCSRIYKRELWDRYEVKFEEGVRGEDVPISLFFNAVCRNIKTVQEAEYYYVQHGGSATHNFRGLRNFKLPYRTVEWVMEKLSGLSEINSREFLELGFMRFFTQCIFDLGKGAQKEHLQELCRFVESFMEKYFPEYWKNKKSVIWSQLDIPFINKVEVRFFLVMLKLHVLYPTAWFWGKI